MASDFSRRGDAGRCVGTQSRIAQDCHDGGEMSRVRIFLPQKFIEAGFQRGIQADRNRGEGLRGRVVTEHPTWHVTQHDRANPGDFGNLCAQILRQRVRAGASLQHFEGKLPVQQAHGISVEEGRLRFGLVRVFVGREGVLERFVIGKLKISVEGDDAGGVARRILQKNSSKLRASFSKRCASTRLREEGGNLSPGRFERVIEFFARAPLPRVRLDPRAMKRDRRECGRIGRSV